MEKSNRILALIDGYNYYHRLDEYYKNYNKCTKWLNYRRLIESWLNEKLDDKSNIVIYYFSALANHRGSDSVLRHKLYIKALKKVDINVVLGEFKKKSISRCPKCNLPEKDTNLIRHEEKQSDVSLAITLVEQTLLDKYDKCFILTSDNDFVTAIKKAKNLSPDKRIILCPPPYALREVDIIALEAKRGKRIKRYPVENLVRATGCKKPLCTNWDIILKNQFPDNFDGLENPWKIKTEIPVIEGTVILESGETLD